MFGNDHKENAVQDKTQGQAADDSGFNPALPPADHSFAPIKPDDTTAAATEPTSTPTVTDSSLAASNDSPQSPPKSDTTPDNGDDLLDIKQQALTQLSPLVSHLDQTPEDKFKTLMMMIQANDNQSLIKEAYDTAQTISDDKAKAQALLDVINEINYFTHQGEDK